MSAVSVGWQAILLLMLINSALPNFNSTILLMHALAAAFSVPMLGILEQVQVSLGLLCLQLDSFANAYMGCGRLYFGTWHSAEYAYEPRAALHTVR